MNILAMTPAALLHFLTLAILVMSVSVTRVRGKEKPGE